MPATAGRVRMPANNRVHSSAALQTHGIWQSAIGYDPYAPNKDESKGTQVKASAAEPEGGENSYASFQGLLALARITNSNTDVARGACPKCGRVGHLKYQCRNFLSLKDEKEKELNGVPVLTGLDNVKGGSNKSNQKAGEESDESSEGESESSDSDIDPEMERLIAERYGNKASQKGKVSKMKEDSESDDSKEKRRKKKRGRSVKRSGKRASGDSDEDDSALKRRRREKRKKRHESSDDEKERRRRHRKSRKEKRRRRSHKDSDSSDESDDSADRKHRRRSKRAVSPSISDSSHSDDSRIGRRKKRSEKRSRKNHREDDD
ncbi:unnamed protein product [Rhodiola kirilowii]